MFSFCAIRWFQSSLTYHDICGPHWGLRSYSSQASELKNINLKLGVYFKFA